MLGFVRMYVMYVRIFVYTECMYVCRLCMCVEYIYVRMYVWYALYECMYARYVSTCVC